MRCPYPRLPDDKRVVKPIACIHVHVHSCLLNTVTNLSVSEIVVNNERRILFDGADEYNRPFVFDQTQFGDSACEDVLVTIQVFILLYN